MQPVSVNCPVDAEAPRSRVSAGRPGRYMSIDSGPNADSAPRITIWRGLLRQPARESDDMCRFPEPPPVVKPGMLRLLGYFGGSERA